MADKPSLVGPSVAKPAFTLSEEELAGLVTRAVGAAIGQRQLLVDKQGLARTLGCSSAQIDLLRKRGLPSVSVGQLVRFEPEVVLDWLRKQTKSNDG